MEAALETVSERRYPLAERLPPGRPAAAYSSSVLHLWCILVLWTATRLLAEELWWTTLLLYLPQGLYALPGLAMLAWSVRRRNAPAVLFNLAALAIVGGPMMGLCVPTPAALLHPARDRVRVLTFNIAAGQDGFAPIHAQVQHCRPDVVVFSEAAGGGRDAELHELLRQEFAGWDTVLAGDLFVASRWPITAQAAARLGPDVGGPSLSNRLAVRVTVQAPFGRFHVVGAHFHTALHGETLFTHSLRVPGRLEAADRVRRDQVEGLVEWTRDLDAPVIVAGDFNTPPCGAIYGSLREQYRDAFSEAGMGWGYTYPARAPLLRIDYVFHSDGWTTHSAQASPLAGSDHRAVFAELALRETPRAVVVHR
jgi:vancomycin resistance protein VanJ